MLLAAKVWHYWLSVALLIPTVLLLVAMTVGYLRRVVAQRYPKQQ